MSTTLTIALASLGGVVLAGLVAHGAWSARRADPRRAETPADRPEPREPVMDPMTEASPRDDLGMPAVPETPGGTEAVDAARGLDSFGLSALRAYTERRPPSRRVMRLDALIDAVATLTLESPIGGAQVIPHLPGARRAGSKTLLIEGLDTETGEWETPRDGQRYGEFQAGVQLANRTGALNEIEFSEFVQKVQTFADAIGAMASFPDMLEAVATARELDAFAGQHDAQLAVQLQCQGAAWSVGYILQHAARHGFVPGVVPGRLVMAAPEEGAPPLLTLVFDSQAALADDPNLAALRKVTLGFDVPQTDPSLAPFSAWRSSAQALASSMGAAVVDDDGRPLTEEAFAAIGHQLQDLYKALEARDLAAGSPAARRLFA